MSEESEDIVEEMEDLYDLEEPRASDGRLPDQGMLAAFKSNPLPVIIMDGDLRVTFFNEACSRLFAGFYEFAGSRLPDIFGRALGVVSLRELLTAIRSPENGFSWKGLIRSKAREAGTKLTKSFLFPIYACESPKDPPPGFVAIFDDITEENRALLRSVFLSLLEASKLKDNDTGKHINRVNLYSERLSLELFDRPGYQEIDRDFIDDIAFLAAMHDVGKIGTPDDILNKTGPLSDWEWAIMKEHTKNGAYILSTYPNPMAREIALYHHERWDGAGYPYNLEGTMIPLAARIVTIADVYDALRMKRSYKNAYDHAAAASMVREWSGTHFDPALIAVFDRIEDEFESIYLENAD